MLCYSSAVLKAKISLDMDISLFLYFQQNINTHYKTLQGRYLKGTAINQKQDELFLTMYHSVKSPNFPGLFQLNR